MKVKAKQMEVKWDMPEPFALATQITLDGDRIAREKQESEKSKAHMETMQGELRAT